MSTQAVQQAIRTLLERERGFTSTELAVRTGLSRQALHRHLTRAVDEGWLVREGRARATRYGSPTPAAFERSYPTEGLAEDRVWRELEAWLDERDLILSRTPLDILAYALTEMVNNAIDHSGAAGVEVRALVDATQVRVTIEDLGIGAFENLRSRLQLTDELHALQELAKGKTTTSPEHHTGEGIFFSSKMVQRFELVANGLAWIVDNERCDQAVREDERRLGTAVEFAVSTTALVTCAEVFERYTHDFEFDTTRCVVRLFEYGTDFVSRSEAKRLLTNLERFARVILDFRGVRGVGQGFVDEIFRVWARAHPEVTVEPEGMNSAVEFMVRRGLARGEEPRQS